MQCYCPPILKHCNKLLPIGSRNPVPYISTIARLPYSRFYSSFSAQQVEEDDFHTARFPSPSPDRVEKLLQYTIDHLPKTTMENLRLVISDDKLQSYKKEMQQFVKEQLQLYQQEMNDKELYFNEEQLHALGFHFVTEMVSSRDNLSETEVRFVLQFLLIGDNGIMDMDQKKELKKQIKQRHETEVWATKELSRERIKELLTTKQVPIDETKPLEERKYSNLSGAKMFNNKTGHEIDDDDH